jgi:hypothetical protein
VLMKFLEPIRRILACAKEQPSSSSWTPLKNSALRSVARPLRWIDDGLRRLVIAPASGPVQPDRLQKTCNARRFRTYALPIKSSSHVGFPAVQARAPCCTRDAGCALTLLRELRTVDVVNENERLRMKSKKISKKPSKTQAVKRTTALRYGVADLRVAQVYGVNDKRCLCGDDDCVQVGVHLRAPIEEATSIGAEIRAFQSKWSKSRIAIATGGGIIALRVTGKKRQAALAEVLSSAATVEVIDRDSVLYLFKMPAEDIPEGCVALRKGVEVLGGGAYFVAPNDLNTAREVRRFAEGGVVGEVDIAAAPGWLLGSLRPHRIGINARSPSPGAKRVKSKTVSVDVNCIVDGNESCDPNEVKLQMESILETGPRMPPAVRLDSGFRHDLPLYSVLAGRCQIEALKSLGATHVECVLVDADEDGAVIWQLAELFNQPRKTVLERAELAVKCLEIVRRKGVQVGQPRGGRQPQDRGISKAARILSISRSDLGRLEKIGKISVEAKEQVRVAGLDDNQRALEAIADLPLGKQVEKVLECKDQYVGGRQKRSSRVIPKQSGRSSAAVANKKGVETKSSGEADKGAPRSTNADAAEDENDDAETEGSSPDSEDDVGGKSDNCDAGADSPPIVPEDDGLGIPTFLRRTDGQKQYEAFRSQWARHCAAGFADLPAAMQTEFASELLGIAVIATGKGEEAR